MASEPLAEILVVDDRPEQRLSLTAVVSDLGASVVAVASGRDALRLLLQREFAVILLDVNMPDMDGFETAKLIRQRKRSEHMPIIFVTAYGDEAHEALGYSLGAVDYIQTPVEPQLLRAKVSVFVELFRRRREVTQQAESLRRNAMQLRRLADASLAIHGAGSVDELIEIVAGAAASLIGAEHAAVEVHLDLPPLADKGAEPVRHTVVRPPDSSLEGLGTSAFDESAPCPVRLTRAELAAHPEWGRLSHDGPRRPLQGLLAVPLVRRDGRIRGSIQISEKREGEFTADDESLLALLARKASLAIENTLYSKVEEASRLKDEFLATLSHELRTPLQSMLSWARMLRDEKIDAAMLERGLEVIERSANAQKQLIDDLLDVSRIMSDKLRLELDTVSLRDVIERAIADVQPSAVAGEIEIAAELSERPLVVQGDPHRLQQVMGNLLANAIKFTPRGGNVTIALAGNAEEATIHVIDSGEGIAADFLPHLFERFRQADSAHTRAHGGLGIGLAIVRHLVELHGGSVRAQSAGEGKGSTFSVKLPVSHRSELTRATLRTPAIEDEASHERIDGVRILLVDDHEDARECLMLMLSRHGGDVISAASASEALALLDRVPVDVVLSDIAMPGTDGLALIEAIRKRSPADGGLVPAAALSAYARSEDARRATRAGFDLHLAKPVREGSLIRSIRSLASRVRAGG